MKVQSTGMKLSLINEKCNFEYYHELTPEPRILDAGDILLLAGLPAPWTLLIIYEVNFIAIILVVRLV